MINKKVLIIGIAGIAGIAGLIASTVIESSIAEEQLQEGVAELSPFVDMKYDDFSIGLFSNDVTLSNVTLIPQGYGAMMYGGAMGLNARSGIEPITIKKLEVSNLDLDGDLPKSMSFTIDDLKIPTPENSHRGMWRNVPAPIMERLGKEGAMLDFELVYEISGDTLELEITSGIEKWGEVSFEAELDAFKDTFTALSRRAQLMEGGDADYATAHEVERALQTAVRSIEVDKISVMADDDGLMRAFFSAIAEKQGVSVGELVDSTAAKMFEDADRLKDTAPLKSNAMQTMGDWIEDQGGAFTVVVKPGKEQNKLMALLEELERDTWGRKAGSEFAVTFDH